jgi:effector-binding domain-containing protein
VGEWINAFCSEHLRLKRKTAQTYLCDANGLAFRVFSKQRRKIVATANRSSMKLTQEPDVVNWPETHYVFVEKIGPFQDTAPQAWQNLHQFVPKILEHNKITGYTSLYKVAPKVYRAGVSLAAAPSHLPDGVGYEEFKGGKFSRFVLTGPYSNLPEACGRVFEMVAEKKIPLRDDYYLENYTNDPRTTPEEELVTEILIPMV